MEQFKTRSLVEDVYFYKKDRELIDRLRQRVLEEAALVVLEEEPTPIENLKNSA